MPSTTRYKATEGGLKGVREAMGHTEGTCGNDWCRASHAYVPLFTVSDAFSSTDSTAQRVKCADLESTSAMPKEQLLATQLLGKSYCPCSISCVSHNAAPRDYSIQVTRAYGVG